MSFPRPPVYTREELLQSRYYFDLDLPITPLREGFEFPQPYEKTPHTPTVIPPEELLNPALIEFFAARGVKLDRCHIFSLKAGGRSIIHKDGQKGGRNPIWAINWTLFDHLTDMSWFALKQGYEDFEPAKRDAINPNNNGAGGEEYPNEVLHLVAREMLKGPTLVRVDVPHCVVNHTDQMRWCVSIREGNGRPWQDIVTLMDDLIRL